MSWYELKGTVKTRAGTSGTETFSEGARILQIIVVGGTNATMQIPNGSGSTVSVPMPSNTPWILEEDHASRIMGQKEGGANTGLAIVFTATASYFVEYLDPPGVS